MAKKLPTDFFQQASDQLAPQLLGATLVRVLPSGERLAGRIVEVEAYLGVGDRAAHTFGGRRTERVEAMYLAGGHAYIYFVYGMHFCFNVVAGPSETPQAVLVRAIEPIEGLKTMRANRPAARAERDLTNGPGKLCQALQIDRELNGLLLTKSPLFIEAPTAPLPAASIARSPRIGVDYAGEAAAWPLRFFVKDSAFVSRAPSVVSTFKKLRPTDVG